MNHDPLNKNEYIRKRAQNMGLTMIVMGISFFLYYLGLFGNVEGPLTPGNIGEYLAGMGVTKVHMLMFFFLFFIIALTWNQIFNMVNYIAGAGFHSVKKGVIGHTVWVVALVLCAIIMYCS